MKIRTVLILLATLLFAAIASAQLRPVDPATLAGLRRQEPQRIQAALDFANLSRTRWMLDANASFVPAKAQTDEFGFLHVRLIQQYRGLEVLGGNVIVHIAPDGAVADPTLDLRQPIGIDIRPQINEDSARNSASVEFARRGVPPLAATNTKLELVIYPERQLVTVRAPYRDAAGQPVAGEYEYRTRNVFLAWSVLAEPAGATPRIILVDAQTGRVLRSQQSIFEDDYTPATGTAQTKQFGNVSLSTAWNSTKKQFELRDVSRNGNFVVNQNNSDDHAYDALVYSGANNAWGDGKMFTGKSTTSANGETAATDVAFTLERTFDMLKNVFGRNGIDGAGKEAMQGRVHHDTLYGDAHYNHGWKAAFFGDGAKGATNTRTSFETVSHEFGHAMFSYELASKDGFGIEARGINEGQGDIMASISEFYYLGAGGTGNYLPDVVADWNWRSRMVDPPSNGPWSIKDKDGNVLSSWKGFKYYDNTVSQSEEHASGCLYGHIFILLARGASPDNSSVYWSKYTPLGTQGIGVYSAARLWYRATTVYFPNDPTFFGIRSAYMLAAADLFGANSREYRAVMNAFHAGGIGSKATDNAAPVSTISVTPNEIEGSLYINASATDDVGVVSFKVHRLGETYFDGAYPPFTAYASLADFEPGDYIIVATAKDASGKAGVKQAPFTLTGVNQLFANGTFEAGNSGWAGKNWNLRNDEANAFLGKIYASSEGFTTGYMSQTVTIPASATSANFWFRLRIDGSSKKNKVTLTLTDAAKVKHVLGTYTAETPFVQAVSRNYNSYTMNLKQYAGQKVTISFDLDQPEATSFFSIDNVSLTYVAPFSLAANADPDMGENTITMSAQLTGIPNNQVDRVDFYIDGQLRGSAGVAPFYYVVPAAGLSMGTHSLVAVLTRFGSNVKTQSAPDFFELKPVNNLVKNGGFEQGSNNWILSDFSALGQNSGEAKIFDAFQGSFYAKLGGKGKAGEQTFTQDLTIPKTATGATLGFRLRVATTDIGQPKKDENVIVKLTDQWGNVLQSFGPYGPAYPTGGSGNWNSYSREKFPVDLKKVKTGQPIQLVIEAIENNGSPTRFLLDNIYLTYTTLGISN